MDLAWWRRAVLLERGVESAAPEGWVRIDTVAGYMWRRGEEGDLWLEAWTHTGSATVLASLWKGGTVCWHRSNFECALEAMEAAEKALTNWKKYGTC